MFRGSQRYARARAPHHSGLGTPGPQEARGGPGRAARGPGSNRLGQATRCGQGQLGWAGVECPARVGRGSIIRGGTSGMTLGLPHLSS